MVEGVKDRVIQLGMMSESDWAKAIDGLYRTAEGGTFLYMFFKGTATR
jgi:hypothetical protein